MTSKLLSHLSYLLLALLTYMYTELKHALLVGPLSINNYSHSPVVGSSMVLATLAKPPFNNILSVVVD